MGTWSPATASLAKVLQRAKKNWPDVSHWGWFQGETWWARWGIATLSKEALSAWAAANFCFTQKMIWGLRSPHQQSGDFLLRVATANMFLNQNTLCILYSRVRKNVGPVSAVVFWATSSFARMLTYMSIYSSNMFKPHNPCFQHLHWKPCRWQCISWTRLPWVEPFQRRVPNHPTVPERLRLEKLMTCKPGKG